MTIKNYSETLMNNFKRERLNMKIWKFNLSKEMRLQKNTKKKTSSYKNKSECYSKDSRNMGKIKAILWKIMRMKDYNQVRRQVK
jgi:hypothetical protein